MSLSWASEQKSPIPFTASRNASNTEGLRRRDTAYRTKIYQQSLTAFRCMCFAQPCFFFTIIWWNNYWIENTTFWNGLTCFFLACFLDLSLVLITVMASCMCSCRCCFALSSLLLAKPWALAYTSFCTGTWGTPRVSDGCGKLRLLDKTLCLWCWVITEVWGCLFGGEPRFCSTGILWWVTVTGVCKVLWQDASEVTGRVCDGSWGFGKLWLLPRIFCLWCGVTKEVCGCQFGGESRCCSTGILSWVMVTDVRNMLGLDAVEYRDCRGFVSSMPLLWLESIGITWRSVDPKPLLSPESTDTTWRESNGLNALVWLEFAETTCSSDCPKPLFWLAFTEAAWRFDGPKRLVRFESTEISWTSVWGFNWTFLLTTDDSKGCLSSACFTWHIVLLWAFGGFSWTWARKWGCMLLVVSNCDSSWKEWSSWFWGSTGLSRESFLLWKKVWSWWCWIILVWDSGWECACTKTLEASCATTGCPSCFTPWELRISVTSWRTYRRVWEVTTSWL